ncbi:LysR family transcriptional regulator [Thaumasiovibrio subtropicus]|uniref:LysR family transcriptional regulator n=1 Tax=Thaumasiovibrio subtropicus TaxID=1891207 RepID=UPI000B362BDB|nr:LysR family transcriptional regulator [Thaumasiovibrio subtropicus]
MNSINWRGIDLNLLVAFDALYENQSVTKAANQLSMGQSAMSHNLSRLRQLLDDPLFERQGQQMIPSQRAIDLAPLIHDMLSTIREQILKPAPFDHQSYLGEIRIGLTDYAEFIFAPIIYDAIHQHAPYCQLSFHQVDRSNYQDKFAHRHLDVVIGSLPNIPNDYQSLHLYRDNHVCLYDAAACEIDGDIPLEAYLDIPHALVSPDGQLKSQVDATLAKLNKARRVNVGSANFLTVRHLLKKRRLLCITTELMAKQPLFNDQLTFSPPPIEVAGFDISLISQQRNAHHPKWIWLIPLLKQTICEYVTEITQ